MKKEDIYDGLQDQRQPHPYSIAYSQRNSLECHSQKNHVHNPKEYIRQQGKKGYTKFLRKEPISS